MSILGDLFGYDGHDDDLLGSNRDSQYNCPVCGMNAMRHSPEQNSKCLRALYGERVATPEKENGRSLPTKGEK